MMMCKRGAFILWTPVYKFNPNSHFCPIKLYVWIKLFPYVSCNDLDKYIFCHNKWTFAFFQEATDPVLHQVYNRFIAHKRYNLPPNSILGLNKICENKKYAFVTSSLIAAYTENSLGCSIIHLPEAFTREYLSLAVAKNSAYLDIINHK